MLTRLTSVRSLASSAAAFANKNVVLVDGARTPFCRSNAEYDGIWCYDLQREAISGLLKRNPKVKPEDIGKVVCGTVIMDVSTSNIAREAALSAGIPESVPCHTVTLACISSNVAITDITASIQAGEFDIGIAGGVECMSDVPIRWPRKTREWMIKYGSKIKGLGGPKGAIAALGKWKGSKLGMIGFETPAVAEFSTGESMGHSADRLASQFNISREEQDEFAYRSHVNAKKAAEEGKLKDVLKVFVPGRDEPVSRDMGVLPAKEKAASLKAAFIKPHGTITAANASYLTDGASAALIMSEEKALELGLQPMAYLREHCYVAKDPVDSLLLGPAYSIQKMLQKTGQKFSDIDVWEIHEAFSGQVLANRKALASDHFCKEHMGAEKAVGEIPMDKLNNWGGSLSIGHPFGATGVRLITQAAHRLKAENGKYAMISACAAGGHAFGGIIEKYPTF